MRALFKVFTLCLNLPMRKINTFLDGGRRLEHRSSGSVLDLPGQVAGEEDAQKLNYTDGHSGSPQTNRVRTNILGEGESASAVEQTVGRRVASERAD